jgi:hypothetical protein
MLRKMVVAVGVCMSIWMGVGTATAAASPTRLLLSEYGAFHVLGRWCGGISQKVYATGFDAKGFPTGAEFLKTTCNGSGKGGRSITYTAWATSEWDWYGETRSFAAAPGAPEGISETFSAEDSHGDRIYNVGTAAYLEAPSPPVQPPGAPTGVTAYVEEVESGEHVELRFQVGWTPAPETAPLLTSDHVVATPVGSTAPVLEATVGGGSYGTLVMPLERRTTYRITVTSTDREGTSEPSAPIEVNSIGPEEEREKKLEEAEPQFPEFGRCVKAFHLKEGTTTYYYGGYTTAGCTERSSTRTGKYEWEEGVATSGFTIPLKLGPVVLENVNRTKLTCTGESGTGAITGRKTVGEVVLTFTGCEVGGQKCTTSGLAEGEMRTNGLEGALGLDSQTETLGKVTNHIGIDLFPAGKSGAALEYACGGGEPQALAGSIIAPVISNKMQTSSTLKFSQSAGLQKPEAFEGGPQDVLRSAIGEQVGLALNATLHTEEAVEINGVLEPLGD